MKNNTTLVVMNYSGATITFYVIPDSLDTEQVEDWIANNTDHRLSDVHFMTGEDITIVDTRSEQVEQETENNDSTWDFVEKYYPNYDSSDDICRALDLHIEIFDNNNISEELAIEYDMLMKDIYEQAIENFIKIKGGI